MRIIQEKFFNKIKFRYETGCWEWTGGKYKRGYGVLRIGKKMVSAHRFSWEYHFGAIPNKLYVCHRCDNPSCVNPLHLYLGTQVDNMRDARNKGRSAHGESHGGAKLAEKDVLAIRKAHHMSQRELAYTYRVSQQTISRILSGKLWKHI